jgi:hypothetical protein
VDNTYINTNVDFTGDRRSWEQWEWKNPRRNHESALHQRTRCCGLGLRAPRREAEGRYEFEEGFMAIYCGRVSHTEVLFLHRATITGQIYYIDHVVSISLLLI